ncbi:MAG: hypothetical protein M3R13_07195 [Armatimonadota bacterium]|nr:hypothetical protein [Armatimonadota bacterium]
MQPELEWAIAQAREAGNIAMKHYRTGFEVHRKPDDSPVTVADREIETLFRERAAKDYPKYGVLGEEFEETPGGSSRWVIDPIDGTKSFVFGVPLFSTLIGLEVDGKPTLGVAHFPALDETYWGNNEGAFLNGDRIQVSQKSDLSESLLLMGSLKAMDANRRLDAFIALARKAYATRNWGDAYGHCLVARGDAEAMIDPFVSIWDTCAVSAIVEAAGGRFANFAGEDGHTHGEVIACAPGVFEEIMAGFSAE